MATTEGFVPPAPQQSPITMDQVIQFLMQGNNAQQVAQIDKPKTDVSQATPDQVATAQTMAKSKTVPIVPVEGGASQKATLPDVLNAIGIKIPGMDELFGDPNKKADANRDNAKNNGKQTGGATKAIDAISSGSLDGTKLGSVVSAVTKLAGFL